VRLVIVAPAGQPAAGPLTGPLTGPQGRPVAGAGYWPLREPGKPIAMTLSRWEIAA
jgi:hypothetical protein